MLFRSEENYNSQCPPTIDLRSAKSRHHHLLHDSVCAHVLCATFVDVARPRLITILIGRFLLHLQESAARMLRVPTDNSQGLDLAIDTRPSFVRSRIMGSIAHCGNDGENELEDEDNAAEYETQPVSERRRSSSATTLGEHVPSVI